MAENQDLQESALPKVKSVAYIRGINSDGHSVSISKDDLFESRKAFYLQVGEEVDTGINNAGIIIVTAPNITGSALIGVSSINSTFISVLSEGSGSISFTDNTDKIYCFKKEAHGSFFLRNNTVYYSSHQRLICNLSFLRNFSERTLCYMLYYSYFWMCD